MTEEFSPVWYTIREPLSENLHVLARSTYEFESGETSVRHMLRISADDYYKVYINGIFAAQGPAVSYIDHYYYNEIPIDQMLTSGTNIIAVHAFYHGRVNRAFQSGDGRFALTGNIASSDGKNEDLLWKYQITDAYSGEVIGYDTQFLENFDSRKWKEDWKEYYYADNTWAQMIKAEWADYHLFPQPTELLSVYECDPAIVEWKNSTTCFVDAGKEIAGCLLLSAVGSSGQKVRILCAEELDENGNVRFDMRCNCRYEEVWTLSDGICKLEPYDYKGFRYAQIETEPGIELMNIRLQIRHYPMDDDACVLHTDNETLNQIFQICKQSVKMGTQDGYMDCVTREKGQYLGDALITGRSQAWLSGSTKMLRKCIEQFGYTAKICDGLLAVAPGSFHQEIADYSLLFPEVVLTEYLFSGDLEFLSKQYAACANVLTHFTKYRRPDGLLEHVTSKWNMVDWPPNLRDDYDFSLTEPIGEGCHNVMNALYIGAMKTMSQIEEILGYPVSCDYESVQNSYVSAFYRPSLSLFADSTVSDHTSLHSNVYALYFGLAPKEVINEICDFIMEKGFSCGVMMSYFVLRALAGAGRYEDVYRLLINEGEHGWVNMLRQDASTCFEAWGKEQKWNTSLCHPWASAPISILIEEIGGIKPDPSAKSGYSYFPHVPTELKDFSLKVKLYGI